MERYSPSLCRLERIKASALAAIKESDRLAAYCHLEIVRTGINDLEVVVVEKRQIGIEPQVVYGPPHRTHQGLARCTHQCAAREARHQEKQDQERQKSFHKTPPMYVVIGLSKSQAYPNYSIEDAPMSIASQFPFV